MSRRDTIIITVLINAALLALLFMLAINTNDDVIVDTTSQGQTPPTTLVIGNTQPLSKPSVVNPSIVDEVDNFLKDLPQEELRQPILVDEDGYIELDQPQTRVVSSKPEVDAAPVYSQETNIIEVTVKRGDALEKIARNNGTTVEAIKKANNMSSTKLSIGQVLRIPVSKNSVKTSSDSSIPQKGSQGGAPNAAVKEVEKKVPVNAESNYYTMKTGDNLWKVARQFQTTPENLLRLNDLDEDRARNLKVGDKIRVK